MIYFTCVFVNYHSIIDSNNEVKEIYIKNRTYYYFDDITTTEDFNLDNILIDEKSYVKNFSLQHFIQKFDC